MQTVSAQSAEIGAEPACGTHSLHSTRSNQDCPWKAKAFMARTRQRTNRVLLLDRRRTRIEAQPPVMAVCGLTIGQAHKSSDPADETALARRGKRTDGLRGKDRTPQSPAPAYRRYRCKHAGHPALVNDRYQ